MNNSTSRETNDTPNQRETYAARGSSTATNWFAKRTAAREAAFFLPYLRSGMRLLDCGFGSGSITVGLAEMVAPGQVVAFDNDAETIQSAEIHAEEQGVSNIRFETADIYTIPFPADSFDAVFSHAVLEHLRDPVEALKEMQRVVKAGGVVGVRTLDIDGVILAPEDPLLMQTWSMWHKFVQHHGGNFKVGKLLRALLNSAGFARVDASASYDSYASLEATRAWAERMASELLGHTGSECVRLGLADREAVKRMAAAWRTWGEDPDAFHARPWCEAVGWKE